LELEAMLKKTTIAVAATILMLGAASDVRASKDDSGDYKGGARFGPLPGQVFGHGWARGRAFGFTRRGRAYAYAYAPRMYRKPAH
jgi:hypothetical protein